MLHPSLAFRRCRRAVALSMVSMALSAGALVWSGAGMIGVGMTGPGYASLAAAVVIIFIGSQLRP